MKIYLASDMHIGYEDSNYSAIMDFLELVRVDADELILLGDTLDLWTNKIENITSQEPYKAAYDKLMKVSSVVPTTMVCGNHDYKLKKYIRNPNITIEKRFTRGTCRFMHGWEFDAMQVAASPLFECIMECFPYIYQKFFYKPNSKYKLSIDGNRIINNTAREYAKKKGFSHILYGHTHLPMIDKELINCGDMIEHSTYIILRDGVAELWDINANKKVNE